MTVSLRTGLVGRLKRSPLYGMWRAYRRFQQLGSFDALLDKRLAVAGGRGYSSEATRQRLHERAEWRRAWPAPGLAPSVIAFGTGEWESRGLWPSFASSSEFRLWEYRTPNQPHARPDAALRAGLAQRFLEYVEDIDRTTGVHCVFFYASGGFIASELLQELARMGIWTIILGLDDKHQFTGPSDASGEPHQLRVARLCDIYWTTWRTAAEIVIGLGGNAWYGPTGADPAYHRPLGLARDLEVVFVGQAYGPREALVRYLRRRGFEVAAFGSGWPGGFVDFAQTLELFSRAGVVLGCGGVGHMHEVNHLKGRDFEVPMCGALYLTSYNSELAEFFDIGKEVLCYGSMQECADILHWVRHHPQEADRIRTAGLARSLREHTWVARLQAMLNAFPRSPDRETAEPGAVARVDLAR